jgi:hypothetical protein
MNRVTKLLAAGVLGLVTVATGAQGPTGDEGETAEAKKLKGRLSAPTSAQMDTAVTLDSMLKKGEGDLSQEKGVRVQGYLVQEEKESEDSDIHLVLATTKGETDTKKWVIAEITPTWQKKSKALSFAAVRKLHGYKVWVTGWLYWEPDADQPDPRGTRWEIHPVTEITPGVK